MAIGSVACSTTERPAPPPQTAADSQAAHIRDVAASGGTVDSILPVAEMLARFQATTSGSVDSISRGSTSIDALVSRFAVAIAKRDTAAFNAMLIDRAEFAWLYYPDSKMSKPPYEAPPGLLWDQMLSGSDEGIRKAMARFGATGLAATAVQCPTVSIEGRNRLHSDCLVSGERPFSTILERDGRFKFLSYANRL